MIPAAVAQPVPKKDIERIPKALEAQVKEWERLIDKEVWSFKEVKDWSQCARDARRENKTIHLGRIFGIMVLKGAELPADDPRREYKYRVVFHGNRVIDQDWSKAQFADLGSAPATIEAARTCVLRGLLKGNKIQQADAMQAYVQAKLGGTETWVELPEEGWPEE